MATYNGEKYLREQLDSFGNQTLLPDEVIITDDCSTDNTLRIINECTKQASFKIKVYQNEHNLGYTQNFNKALSLCSGEIVFLSDQDDVWFDNKVEYMVNLVKQYPAKSVFMCDAELTDEVLSPVGITKQMQIKRLRGKLNGFVTGCCIVVKKDFLDKVLPIPQDFKGHDNWIVSLSDALNQRYVDGKVLQYYRRHGQNESMSLSSNLETISLVEKIKLVYKRIIRKFFIKNWIEYFRQREHIKTKIKDLSDGKRN